MVTEAELLAHTENKINGDVRIDNKIVCREKQSTYCYINQSRHRVAKIDVDGGLVKDKKVEQCDYLLINWDSHHSFFIELKGSDVRKAISQIIATLDLLWADISNIGICVAHVRIIPTKAPRPDLIHNQRRDLEQRLKQCNGGYHKIKEKLVDIKVKVMVETF